MKRIYLLILLIIAGNAVLSQTNILSTNPLAEQIMLGNYNPGTYQPAVIIADPHQIAAGINQELSSDSLYKYMLKLETFHNRNTASDTVSTSRGIGAARRWIYSMFQEFSIQNENRLIPTYLQFNNTVCNTAGSYRNIIAVLPGTDTSDKSIVLIEGHVDSRCEVLCDTSCLAQGMEDNATGTALVMELARVMSKYTFKRTIVFMVTIGEEQGLLGADAFAKYAVQKQIKIAGVMNNDVIGGIICGKTSSPPSCPGLNNIDSTHMRLFSYGKNASLHKGLARYTKLQYEEELLPIVSVPMSVLVMNAEDRTGRGGDHIPFRQQGFTAIRFTAANEHGDANPVASYTDRQHSSRDVLGADTDSNNVVDSFYVDFNYLARNGVINGVTATMIAQAIAVPTFDLINDQYGIRVNLTSSLPYDTYRIGVRTKLNDFNAIYLLTDSNSFQIPGVQKDTTYFISVCSVDSNGVESLFSVEKMAKSVLGVGILEQMQLTGIELLPTHPNPFDETTTISILVNEAIHPDKAFVRITDLEGKLIKELPLDLQTGINEVIYDHGYNASGTYIYTLFIDGKALQARKMVFSN